MGGSFSSSSFSKKFIATKFTVVFVVSVGMYIGRNRRNRLVLVYVDQMLDDFRLSGGVCAEDFWPLSDIVFDDATEIFKQEFTIDPVLGSEVISPPW